MDEAISRSGIPPSEIEAVYLGVGMIGSAVLSPARQALLSSSLPDTTPSLAVDRACCSGMTSIGLALKDIRAGASEATLCGGFESLSNAPLLMPRRRVKPLGQLVLDDPLLLRAPMLDSSIAIYTSEEALKHGVSREMQDDWALQSHQRYFAADARGFFDDERFAVKRENETDELFSQDESPRSDASIDKLQRLSPVGGSKTITAGNAPGLNDGAAVLLMTSRRKARELDLPILAQVRDYVQVSDGPTSGSYTPANAISRLLKRNGLEPASLDLIEINEAFAATVLVSTLRLGADEREVDSLRDRTNMHGGAVAIGHPLGASGARITMTLINALARRGGGLGAAAICGGFGQGDGLLVEVREQT
jgi:acetyl-CoA C-acetyltransferase